MAGNRDQEVDVGAAPGLTGALLSEKVAEALDEGLLVVTPEGARVKPSQAAVDGGVIRHFRQTSG